MFKGSIIKHICVNLFQAQYFGQMPLSRKKMHFDINIQYIQVENGETVTM